MIFLPVWWLPAALAAAVFADAALSVRPPKFIRDCLHGVKFPENYWWALVAIKVVGTAGLITGIWVPGIAIAANVGVVSYFLCAVTAHLRARFFTSAFWVNCLGYLTFSSAILVAQLLLPA